MFKMEPGRLEELAGCVVRALRAASCLDCEDALLSGQLAVRLSPL